MSRLVILIGALVAFALVAAMVVRNMPRSAGEALSDMVRGPSPETVVQATLDALTREQKLVVMSASLMVTITSRQDRLVGSAEKTMLVPGVMRYALDLEQLRPADLAWDEATSTVSVRRPPLVLIGPEVDLARIREYREIGILPRLMGAEAVLDDANKRAVRQALRDQARSGELRRQATEAADAALARTFEVPLHAAGIADARVRIVARS
jgi:hypothetical protein